MNKGPSEKQLKNKAIQSENVNREHILGLKRKRERAHTDGNLKMVKTLTTQIANEEKRLM